MCCKRLLSGLVVRRAPLYPRVVERDDIELRELRFLVAAAEEADLPAAARRVGVDELALRDGLIALETKVGARLLATTGSGVRLTDAGRHVLDGAEEVLAALDAAHGNGHGARARRRTEVVDARLEALESTLLELVSAFGMLASEL